MLRQRRKQAYQRKLDAILKLAGQWYLYFQSKQEWPELLAILKNFSDFAGDYVRLLENAPSPMVTPHYVLHAGIERLLHEWNILSRACEQRIRPANGEGFSPNLAQARNLLQGYCHRWHNVERVHAPYVRLEAPVVYFEKLYRISRSVYAPQIPLISIPLTDYDPDTGQWQALAHELGHHIYWNALAWQETEAVHEAMQRVVIDNASLELVRQEKGLRQVQVLQQSMERMYLWNRWLEEVFADVCGVLFTGPAYVLSAQDVAADCIEKIDDFAQGDEAHPSLYLRPLIALQVLRFMVEQEQMDATLQQTLTGRGGIIEKLERRWSDFSQKAGQKYYPGTNLSMSELAGDIPFVVQALLNSQIWPHEKTLWTLIDFYGQQVSKSDIEALEAYAQLSPLPEIPDQISTEGISAPPELEIQSASFKQIWQHLKDKVNSAEIEEQQKPLAHWGLLLGLELSMVHFHTQPHGCTRHWYYPCKHVHDSLTNKPVSC
ncbi:MAG: hypothetical protein JW953_05965 [Anaerolineae bacterium]|nr:hypothetical protein [Anaerolineae bacterium]